MSGVNVVLLAIFFRTHLTPFNPPPRLDDYKKQTTKQTNQRFRGRLFFLGEFSGELFRSGLGEKEGCTYVLCRVGTGPSEGCHSLAGGGFSGRPRRGDSTLLSARMKR